MMDSSTPGVTASNVVNSKDRAAVVRVATGFCMACLVIFYGARLVIRWPWRILFGKDDLAALIASAFSIAQMIIVLAATNQGLGKMPDLLTNDSIVAVEKLIYSTDLLFVLAIYSAKFAVAMLYCRLSSSPIQNFWSSVIMIACGIFCTVSFLVVALQQRPSTPWAYGPETAGSRMARWIAVGTFSNLLDICMIIFPVWLVWNLQTKRSTKAKVIIGFWTRTPLIPISILRLLSLSRTLRSKVFTFDFATTEIFTQVEMCYALIAATTPCLRVFLRAMNTGLINRSVIDSNGYYLGTATSGRSSMRGRDSHMGSKLGTAKSGIELTSRKHGETVWKAAPATGNDKKSIASDSSDRAIVVGQTVDVEYNFATSTLR